MGRQVPKNVRQIGNVSDNTKIYIEDYVDIFLNQLSEKAAEKIQGAFLVGDVVEEEEQDYIYVSGAIQMQNPTVKGKDIIIEERIWKNACETCKEFFGDAEILGWAMAGGEQPFEMNHNIQKMHQKYFMREKSIFVFKGNREKEEKIYINKYREMLEVKGYYVYYEKNVEMQDYMISCRKNSGMTPSETLEDQAAKSFRSIIQEKMEKKERKVKLQPGYIAGVACAALVLGIGASVLEERIKIPKIEEQEQVQEIVSVEVIEKQEEVQQEEEQVTLQDASQEEIPKEDVEEEEVSGIQMEEIYVVKKGDTLASICKEVYGDMTYVSEVCELNGLENGNLIFIGQKLLLP